MRGLAAQEPQRLGPLLLLLLLPLVVLLLPLVVLVLLLLPLVVLALLGWLLLVTVAEACGRPLLLVLLEPAALL
jgi:hypothetical protein